MERGEAIFYIDTKIPKADLNKYELKVIINFVNESGVNTKLTQHFNYNKNNLIHFVGDPNSNDNKLKKINKETTIILTLTLIILFALIILLIFLLVYLNKKRQQKLILQDAYELSIFNS